MADLTYPDEGSRLVYANAGGNLRGVPAGTLIAIYTDPDLSTPATITAHPDHPGAVVGSSVVVDAYSRLPLFVETSGASLDTLYAAYGGGPATPIYARVDDRIDAITGGSAYEPAGSTATHSADTTAVHGIADTTALVLTSDTRLTNARTPTAHAASHASAGADAVTPGAIGAATSGHTHTEHLPIAASRAGVLAVATGAHRWYNDTGAALTITAVRASVGTAPAGASLIVDVHKNGTTIFTTQANRPTVAAGSNTAAGTPAVTSVAAGEYLTVDVDQVGSSTAGSDLTVQFVLTRAI